MNSLDFILGFASGIAGEELTVSWTSGYRREMEPREVRGVLFNVEGKGIGIITLVFDKGLGSFAELQVGTPLGVRKEVLEYRGAWVWPLEVITGKEKKLPYRGQKRGPKPVLRLTARPKVRRVVKK